MQLQKKSILLQKSKNPKYQCRKKQPAESKRLLRKAYYKEDRSSCQNCTCSIRDKVISEDNWEGKTSADESPTWVDRAEKLFKYKPILPFSKQVVSNDLVCAKCSFLFSICRRHFDCLWFLFKKYKNNLIYILYPQISRTNSQCRLNNHLNLHMRFSKTTKLIPFKNL